MAYLGNGIYDLLDVIKASKDPSIAYEGLYQDPMKPKNNVYDYFTYNPDASPYGGVNMYVDNLQPFMSSSFPQEFGVGSLFNPRVGRPEQSIYYKEPEPADPTSDFYQPLPGFINAPQDDYASLYSLPKLDTSRFADVDLESGYLDRAGSSDQDVYSEKPKSFRDSKTLEEYFQNRSPLQSILQYLPTPFNIIRNILSGEGIRSLNQRLRNTDFGQSKTLAEYAMKRRERKQAERAQEAMPEVYRSAKEQGFTNDKGGFSTNRADRAGTSVGSGQFSPSTSRGRSGY